MVDYVNRDKVTIVSDRLKLLWLMALVLAMLLLPPQCLHRSKVGRYRQQMDEPALFIRVMFFGTFRNFPTNQT